MENGFQGKEGQKVPEMTEKRVASISARYMELYEQITGEKFQVEETSDDLKRIENNVSNALKEL
jgi:phosphoribosylaminoimidazole-succinocarboxamide synthase